MELPAQTLVSLLQSLKALPKVELPVREAQLLLAYLGQDLDGLLEALTPTGARIRFEQGPVVTAEGQVPYPPGTALKVRVSPSPEGGVRLQTLEARPPAPPPFLAPLFQSEGLALMVRLAQAEAPEALQPLQALAAEVAMEPEPLPRPPGAGDIPSPRPSAPTPDPRPALVARLPLPVRAALAEALGLPSRTSPETLAEALPMPEALPHAPVADPPPLGTPVVPSPAGRPETPASRILAFIAAHPELPKEVRDALVRLVRPQRERPAAPQENHLAATLRPAVASARSAGLEPMARPMEGLPYRPLLGEASSPVASTTLPAAVTLEAWMREGLRVLGDPQVSPQEAPFHILQAKEQSAFFELPLPGTAVQTLQLWVEWQEEGDAPAAAGGEAPVRFLMGTRFSRLGETRVGFTAAAGHLAVRVWTEHPELLEPEVEALTRELEETGAHADLRVLPLESGAPSLRSLVSGRGWEGLA